MQPAEKLREPKSKSSLQQDQRAQSYVLLVKTTPGRPFVKVWELGSTKAHRHGLDEGFTRR